MYGAYVLAGLGCQRSTITGISIYSDGASRRESALTYVTFEYGILQV
jgi:hypothetical protein